MLPTKDNIRALLLPLLSQFVSGREHFSGYEQNCDFRCGFCDICVQNGH